MGARGVVEITQWGPVVGTPRSGVRERPFTSQTYARTAQRTFHTRKATLWIPGLRDC
jgi:hypothetical protein